MKLKALALFCVAVILTGCADAYCSTGLERIAAAKSNLWEHNDTQWTKWIVVSAAPARIHSQPWTDGQREAFYKDFDPDYLDMWSGQAMNRGDFFRMRGVAVNSTMEYEWQELINPVYGQQEIFKGNGIAIKENGTVADRWFKPGVTPPCMCHNAPLWHTVATQGMVRTSHYGDSVFQDNIANPIYTWNQGFCDWCNKNFIEFMRSRFTALQLKQMNFEPASFNIRAYIAQKRKQAGDKPRSAGQYFQEEYSSQNANDILLTDLIIKEYIRFQHISYILYWIDAAEKTKQSAAISDLAIPACYGNVPRISGLRTFPTIMASQVDIPWSEESTDMQPCFRDDRQAWSPLIYKMGRAVSYHSKPVISVQYQGGDKSIYHKPDEKILPTAIACSEALANGGILCQTWAATEYYHLTTKPDWDKTFYDAHHRHAQFATNHRFLFTDRTHIADTALVYSFPSTFWREFQSLRVETPHKDIFSATARILEDSHIPYSVFPIGHKDIFDDTYYFDKIETFKTIIIPNADCISYESEKLIADWVRNGGRLIILGNVGIFDEELKARKEKAFTSLKTNSGSGSVIEFDYKTVSGLTYGVNILEDSKINPKSWKYSYSSPGSNWHIPSLDDSSWPAALAPFGDRETRGTKPATKWDTEQIWLRGEFKIDRKPENPILYLQHWWDVEIYINGIAAAARTGRGYSFEPYQYLKMSQEAADSLKAGTNTIAVHCTRNIKNPTYGQFIDVGIKDMLPQTIIADAVSSKADSLIDTDLPPTVWLNIWRHGGTDMTSVQMINYDTDLKNDKMNAVKDFTIRLKGAGRYKQAVYYRNDFTADAADAVILNVENKDGYMQTTVPELNVFGILVFADTDEIEARAAASQARKHLERLRISQRCKGAADKDDTLILEAEALLAKIQGNVQIIDFAQVKQQLEAISARLEKAIASSVKNVQKHQNTITQEMLNISAEYKFDFGTSQTAQGWKAVTPDTLYSKESGCGWLETGEFTAFDDEQPDAVHGDYIRTRCFTSRICADGMEQQAEPQTYTGKFRVDCPNGKYLVTIVSGSYGVFPVWGTHNEARTSSTFVKANGILKLAGDRLLSGYYDNRSFSVEVTDGSILLEFYGKNIGPLYANSIQWLVNAVVIQNANQSPTAAAMEYFNKNEMLKDCSVKQWMTLSAFEDAHCSEMNNSDEIDNDLRAKLSAAREKRIKWQPKNDESDGLGIIYFEKSAPKFFRAVGYAKTYIFSKEPQEVLITGSFSQFGKIYLNKKHIFTDDAAAGLLPQEFKTHAKLDKGWNELIVKSSHYWGTEWAFMLGLMNADAQGPADVIISPSEKNIMEKSL